MSLAGSATLKEAATLSGCTDEELARFGESLRALSLHQATRINPFAFAEAAGLASETAVDIFVHGAKLGLFDLEWGMVCPMCGAITNSVARLDNVEEDVLFCALCARDAPSVLDDTVEVTYAYNPGAKTFDMHGDFPSYLEYHTSSSYPYREGWQGYHKRHTVADIKLGIGASGGADTTVRSQANIPAGVPRHPFGGDARGRAGRAGGGRRESRGDTLGRRLFAG